MKTIYGILMVMMIFLNYSCERDLSSEGVSIVTSYVNIKLNSGDLVTAAKGTYVEPGFTAMEGETDVTDNVVVDGTVNANQPGLYKVSYSAVNKEGFSASVERTVMIYDPAVTADLSGTYTASTERAAPYARGPFLDLSVTVTKFLPGIFYVSDFLGGFYDQSATYGYGPTYAMTGYFMLNPNNTITHLSSHVAGWGDSLSNLLNGVYNPATSTITWNAIYTANNYNFKVILDK